MTARQGARAVWPANGAAAGALVPRRQARVHGVELDSESVLYDEDTGRLHFLNWSASAVWWSIDGIASADELAANLARTLQAASAGMRDDVLRLLAMLGSQQLIEPVSSRAVPSRGQGLPRV